MIEERFTHAQQEAEYWKQQCTSESRARAHETARLEAKLTKAQNELQNVKAKLVCRLEVGG